MKSNFKKLTEAKYFPLICYAAAVFAFSLLLTRYFLKMDDGNFLGIVSAPDFTYKGWLTERYNTLSGRTVGEALLAFFMRHDILWWKIANSAIIVYLAFVWCRLSEQFSGEMSLRRRYVFCCSVLFFMMISCLNPSVFWCAGSFTYLWPFFGLTVTVSPLVFYVLSGKLSTVKMLLAVPLSLLATAQEQSAAAVTALYVILLGTVVVKKLKFRFAMLLPLPVIAFCDIRLFASPGAAARAVMEAETNFARFNEMSVFEKLFSGLAVFFANSFYLSNFLILLFVALLSLALYSVYKNTKNILITVNAFAAVMCVAVNYAVSALKHGLPHMIFRSAIQKGEYDSWFYLLFVLGCVFAAIIAVMAVCLLIKNKRLGFFVCICLAAGFGCAVAMSFSASIFASGQRPFFFTNVFVITACVALISSLPKSKYINILYKTSLVYASITFAVNCVAFRIIELPLMG